MENLVTPYNMNCTNVSHSKNNYKGNPIMQNTSRILRVCLYLFFIYSVCFCFSASVSASHFVCVSLSLCLCLCLSLSVCFPLFVSLCLRFFLYPCLSVPIPLSLSHINFVASILVFATKCNSTIFHGAK